VPRRLDNESWEAFCARVAAASGDISWRWVAVARNEDEWGLVALVVEAGAAAPPEVRIDRYPGAIVAVEELSPAVSAERLLAFRASGEPEVAFPPQHNAVLHRVWSTERWSSTPTGWPSLVLDAGSAGAVYVDPNEALSALGLPFYPSLGHAVTERVLCVAAERIHLHQLPPLSFRLIDPRGRIAALVADGENMRIEVEEGIARGLQGFTLRLAWRAKAEDKKLTRFDHLLSGAKPIVVETGGVPVELFATLIDPGGEQVDQREFDRSIHGPAEDPETLKASVARWVLDGEHGRLEYKQELTTKADTRTSFAETVAAFANGEGGEILIGVADDGTVVGWGDEKPLDRVTNIITDLVKETPAFEVREVEVEGKPIVLARVFASPPALRPHLVRDRAMIRVNATTRRASPAELRNLVVAEGLGTNM
jgi:hypothetical protein